MEAPIERCFWLALSVDAHAASARQTQEQVVGGVQHGLLQLGDSVTFRGRHFGVWQTLTSEITALEAPTYFRDEMRQGAFRQLWHAHYFVEHEAATHMRDVFYFTSPFGWLGRLVDALVLKQYMRRFLRQRGAMLKECAETEGWRKFLPGA